MTSLKVISHIEDLVLAGNKMISIFSFQTLMFFTLNDTLPIFHSTHRITMKVGYFFMIQKIELKKKDLLWQ